MEDSTHQKHDPSSGKREPQQEQHRTAEASQAQPDDRLDRLVDEGHHQDHTPTWVEDRDAEDEIIIEEDLPNSFDDVVTLPSEEDEFHMIDYLMGHTPDDR